MIPTHMWRERADRLQEMRRLQVILEEKIRSERVYMEFNCYGRCKLTPIVKAVPEHYSWEDDYGKLCGGFRYVTAKVCPVCGYTVKTPEMEIGL